MTYAKYDWHVIICMSPLIICVAFYYFYLYKKSKSYKWCHGSPKKFNLIAIPTFLVMEAILVFCTIVSLGSKYDPEQEITISKINVYDSSQLVTICYYEIYGNDDDGNEYDFYVSLLAPGQIKSQIGQLKVGDRIKVRYQKWHAVYHVELISEATP